MSIYCPACGRENSDQARFCMYCSGSLNRPCPKCGALMPLRARFCQQCGSPMPQAPPAPPSPAALTGRLTPATTLSGRYRIVRKLGQGGMGAVYLADDTRLPGKHWAIKEMSDAAITDPAERQQAVQAFQQEAQMLAHLDHPNLPKVTDYFSEGGNQYLIMEYVEGQTLEERLDQAGGPLPEAQVVDWAGQLCDVLGYLHSRHPPIVFRDLKPGNIMVQPNGKVKLIDFGIARHFKPGQSRDTQAFGTPGYSPPEQHGKGQTDARSDVYALGATLHQLLTGRDPNLNPFQFPTATSLNPAISTAVSQTIAKAVEVKPENRWQSTDELRRALRGGRSWPAQPSETVLNIPQPAPAGRAASPPAPVAATRPAASLPPQPANVMTVLPPYAAYGKRVGAYLIDTFIVIVIVVIFAGLDEAMYADGGILLLSWLVALAYWVWPTAKSGQTLGKKMLGIQVVLADGSPPGWGRALLRQIIGFGLETFLAYMLIGLLGYLWPLWDKDRQAWHDKIAGTYVVEV